MKGQAQFSRFDWLWFLAWGVASTLWCVTAADQLGATFDEPVYIARGLESWQTGSHGGLMKLGTMPLAPDLATLPLYLWEQWRGVQFDPQTDLEQILSWARAGTLAFWWLLLAYGWKVGALLAGPWGGRLGVALLACEPSLLAHASLATTDIAVAACLLALAYHFCAGRQSTWLRRVAVPAAWFAASVLAKASGLIFGPVCLAAVEADRLARSGGFKSGGPSRGRWASVREILRRLRPFYRDSVQIVACGLIIVFFYCGSDWREEPSFVAWAESLQEGPTKQAMVWVAEHLKIFSNAGEGLARQIKHNVRGPGGHWTYLFGDVQRTYWYYFAAALAIKLTLPMLAMPVAVAAIAPQALANWASLTAAVLLALSPTFRVQIGVRFVLPLVAFALVGLAAAVVQAFRLCEAKWRRRLLAAGAGAVVLSAVLVAVQVWPNALSYANEFWGGTERGYLYLSDSNYDWGQGLKELASWQKQYWPQEQNRPALAVWYFGTDPALKRMPLRHVPLHALPIAGPNDVLDYVRGHFLAVSTTLLYGVADTDAHRQAVDFLRSCQPVARTTTFFIYDFTQELKPVAPSGPRAPARLSRPKDKQFSERTCHMAPDKPVRMAAYQRTSLGG